MLADQLLTRPLPAHVRVRLAAVWPNGDVIQHELPIGSAEGFAEQLRQRGAKVRWYPMAPPRP
jgi:hypothetical protein